MNAVPGYQIKEELYKGHNSVVYRGQREGDDQPVVLKVLNQAYPSPEKIARFKLEYEIIRNLNLATPSAGPALPGVITAYNLETSQNRWVLVLEDFGGESLLRLGLIGQFSLPEFLPLAIRIVDILGQIHQRHIMHKDINPANIVLNPATGQVKLIDFGISTALSRENSTLRNPDVLEGTLAYMSPEQTGRMNRAMDYRTDFYSLGVTFYELLTGQLPFPTTDAMALLHAHIAKQPLPPHVHDPDISQPLSEIILKLMAKNAEDRYQSAYGLKADLEKCLQQWQTTRRIASFPLGQSDISDHFQIPQKLYGREQEIDLLLAAFERVAAIHGNQGVEEQENVGSESQDASCKSNTEVMLVSGYTGIGKSALVQEIYKPITRQRGYFISGKFDQFRRDIPYASLLPAFRLLVRQLLTETEAAIAAWREKLLAALGPNGQVIIKVIPEVELITGPQPEAPDLSPLEAQNRFNLVFQNFIRVFTQLDHPLVIFLDDLQWADGASLKLIEALMTAGDTEYLFLIGAYRDNEVDEAHPLLLTLNEIQKAGTPVNHISLLPLALPYIIQLITDTLHCTPVQAKPLAELVLGKTEGNPFFINEFLKSLYAEGLLAFEFQHGRWRWDLGKIKARDITDNVAKLMGDKVQKLGDKTQQVLKLAACIGNRFDLQTLAIVSEKSPRETAANLWEAMVKGLILPLDDTYKLIDLDVKGLTEEVTVEYKFAHDQIQQAAYSLIPEMEKRAVHRRVGQLLLQEAAPEERGQRIFEIVNHLNLGRALIDKQSERDELAQLNLRAGKKAKASVAYQPAFHYFKIGLELLETSKTEKEEDNSWKRQYDLALALHVEVIEAAYVNGDYEQMEQWVEPVRQQARTLLDQIKVYEIKIQAYIVQNKLLEAVQTGLLVLKLLGIKFPEKPSKSDILVAFMVTKLTLLRKSVEDLKNLPKMSDPYLLAAISIMKTVGTAVYRTIPELFPLMVFKQINLSVKHGNTDNSAISYAHYGVILCGVVGDIEAGYRFAHLALDLLDQFSSKEFKAPVFFTVYFFINPWKEAVHETLKPILEGYQSGLETGNTEITGYLATAYCMDSYHIGKELSQLDREIQAYSAVMVNKLNQKDQHVPSIYHQVVQNLLGLSDKPSCLTGRIYNEEQMLPLHVETNDHTALSHFYLVKLILFYLFQDYAQAVENATKTEKYLELFTGLYLTVVARFYQSLTWLALFPEVSEPERKRILKRVTANQKRMKKWAEHAPMNFLHKFYLVEAEYARVLGKGDKARNYYDQAILLAHENEYLNEEALAYELAARFYLDRKQIRLAQHYMRDAHYTYQRWGAVAKVEDLEARYPQLLLQEGPTAARLSMTTSTSETKPAGVLDLSSVLKASQAISGEIVLEVLLSKLMEIVIENAGAERGFLILQQQEPIYFYARRDGAGEVTTSSNGRGSETWVIEAEGSINQTEVTTLQSISIAQADLSIAIVNYVARTGQSVVLNDAVHEGAFTQDSYITTRQPKSVLCMPLIHQGKLTGLLYLENNLTTGAFTSDRLEVLRVLSSQAAVSLENARLYSNLAASEQRFRTLFENAPLAVFEVDLAQPSPLILAANRQAELVYGWTVEEFTTVLPEQLVPAEAIPQIRQMLARIRTGETITLETINRRRDGTSFPVRMSATPEMEASLNRMIVTVEDITLEKQRQAEAEAIEAERRRIAHEIHDGLAQDLAALRFKATLWHDLVDKSPSQMHSELDGLVEILNGSIREVRRSIFALRPLALDELGFFPALRQFASNFGEQYQLQIKLRISGPEARLPHSLELPLFRIIQESLNNIRKHAQANTVQIHLDLEQVDKINLTIQDDGAGFDITSLEQMFREGHVGLKQMRERVQSINGLLSIQSEAGQGTRVEVALPLGQQS